MHLPSLIVAGLVACASACRSNPPASQAGPRPSLAAVGCDSCRVTPKPGRPSSAADRCLMTVVSTRCASGDRCLTRCLAGHMDFTIDQDGHSRVLRADEVGGGCWHVCFAYTGMKWSPPAAMD